jgi:hypothetical protein
MSRGMPNRLSKKRIAVMPSPKKLAKPASKKVGSCGKGKELPPYQAAKGTNARDSNFPMLGKVKETGTNTSKGEPISKESRWGESSNLISSSRERLTIRGKTIN